MIYDDLKNISRYKGISKNLDEAIDFIYKKKYINRKYGKNIVKEDKIFFNFPENCYTRKNSNLEFEYHKKYIDIHIVINKEEVIAYTSLEKLKETKDYDNEKDFTLMTGKIDTKFYLNKEKFLILFPNEPHIALLKYDFPKQIEKVIFKVECDL